MVLLTDIFSITGWSSDRTILADTVADADDCEQALSAQLKRMKNMIIFKNIVKKIITMLFYKIMDSSVAGCQLLVAGIENLLTGDQEIILKGGYCKSKISFGEIK